MRLCYRWYLLVGKLNNKNNNNFSTITCKHMLNSLIIKSVDSFCELSHFSQWSSLGCSRLLGLIHGSFLMFIDNKYFNDDQRICRLKGVTDIITQWHCCAERILQNLINPIATCMYTNTICMCTMNIQLK